MRRSHKSGKSLRGHRASGGRVGMKAPKRSKRFHGRSY